MKKLLFLLLLAFPALAEPPPGSNNNIIVNLSGLWGAATLASNITLSGGVLSCTTATISLIGCVEPDNSTIGISAGVISVKTTTLGSTALTIGGTTSSISGLTLASPAITGTASGTGTLPDSMLASQGANTVLGALTSTNPSALSVPSCSSATNALIWTSGTGFGCNTISGTVTTTGSPSNGELTQFSGATSITNGNLSGDITTTNTLATTLATVNSNTGTFGSATAAPQFTVNGKGLITAASTNTITPAVGSITGLGTGVATALGDNVGSAGAFVTNGGALGTPSSGNGSNLTSLVYTALPSLSANQVLGALTATTPSGQSVPSCSAGGDALLWTSGTGFGCATGFLTSAGAVTSWTGDSVIHNNSASVGAVTESLISQTKNTVLAGPTTGSNATPTFRALVGADLPNPAATTLGGIESIAAVSHNFLTSISTSGVPAQAQPAVGDISGFGTGVATALGQPIGTAAGDLVTGGTITAGGPTGSATVAPIITYNAAGQLTTVSSATITPAVGSVTGLGTGVATALGDNVGSAGAFVVNGGALGTPSSGTGTNITGLVYTALPSLSANQLLGALTATTPSGQSVPSCSGTGNGLNWTSGTGFGCQTFLTSTTGVTTFSGSTTGLTPNTATSGAVTLGGTLAAGNGGTGQTSVASAFTSFFESVATTLGDLVYGAASGAPTRLAGSTSASQALLTQTGTGSASAAPAWTLASSVTVGTASAANAINSATTTVNTNSATAPTDCQVLTATSGTAATWQTPDGSGTGPALACLYNAMAKLASKVVRIENLGDSILTCNQQQPCAYGPQRIGSTFAIQLINELAQRFQQYSTGFRAIERLSNGSTTVSAGDGYTLTSGTATNSTLLGPQESGVSLNGGSLFTFSNAAVLTIAVGQPYSSVNIACVQGSGTSGYTVTINGSSVGTACGSGSGSNTAVIQNFANPVAQASQPSTGSTLTLTALGATNYLYAYEAVLFCTASQTACTTGFAVDNFGVGGASSPWFASGTKSGAGTGGMVWVQALSGQVGLCVLENGENDANASSGVTSTQQNAQNQIVATACQNLNASVLFWVPPPYNSGGSPSTYSALQQGSLTYCQAQGWACLNMADVFMGNNSGTLSSVFPFTAQDTGMGSTPPWGVAQGMITNSDSQHLTDCGELLATQQFMNTVFPLLSFSYTVTQACSMNPQSSQISTAYTNATTGFTIIQGATANTGQLEFVAPVSQTFKSTCIGYMQVGTTGIVSFELVGASAISNINLTLSYQTAANSVDSRVSATALSSAMATSSITAASNLRWQLDINGVNSTTANSFAVEAHEASGTLTIPAGATCTTQLSGPQ